MMEARAEELSALDVACGVLFDPRPQPRPLPPPRMTAQEALERAVLPALRRPPCLVSFSGGRDSSLVLAAAARVARREQLALPIAATNRFPQAVRAAESDWQERVVAHLGLTEWLRLDFDDELDAIGPYAQRLLCDHGLLWPGNVHFHLPLIDAARGGSLLTGAGGDELFGAACRTRLEALRARTARPEPLDLARLALAFAPRLARQAVLTRRPPAELPWLRPSGQRRFAAAAAAEAAAEPRGVVARMGFTLDLRYLRVGREALAAAAGDGDVLIGHPLCAPELWSAIAAAAAARRGFHDHTHALRALFGGWLPDAVLARSDKATFGEAFWHHHSRAFARDWDGGGVPADLVDAAALREHWQRASPAAPTMTLMQCAWLWQRRRRGPIPRDSGQPAGHPYRERPI